MAAVIDSAIANTLPPSRRAITPTKNTVDAPATAGTIRIAATPFPKMARAAARTTIDTAG